MSCASHCCKDHGCKYGYKKCPVIAGTEPQEFPCEQCQYETEHKFENFTDHELDVVYSLLEWHRNSILKSTPAIEKTAKALLKLATEAHKERCRNG